jgi:hypothetical protein
MQIIISDACCIVGRCGQSHSKNEISSSFFNIRKGETKHLKGRFVNAWKDQSGISKYCRGDHEQSGIADGIAA